MTSKEDGAFLPPTLPVESQEATLNVLKRRHLDNVGINSTSDPSLQPKNLSSISGNSHGPAASLPTSRSASPGTQSTRAGIWRNGIPFTGSSTAASSIADQHLSEDTRDTIFRSFAPHIAVYASDDTEDLVKGKGITGGLLSLLRPFGETVQGKVTTRDSIGASKSWEDFGVHFVSLGEGLPRPRTSIQTDNHKRDSGLSSRNQKQNPYASRRGGNIEEVEALVREHLSNAESDDDIEQENSARALRNTSEGITTSPYFALYLRRMLSGIPISPHEAFSHPVGCILAISSRNKAPIETLRQLYDNTTHGDKRLPIWINNDYLRYYVLIHDEENHDISKSSTLFEQMKRHFGLNCHLLRLRTTRSIPTDDDVTPLPDCEWISAAEELQKIHDQDHSDNPEEELAPFIQESDAHAVRTFIREMVTQSIVPFMERWVTTWNDQVASRRRGLSGRFMSLSKKWTGFSASSRSTSGNYASSGSSSSSSNYDTLQGFYRPDSPEATMRKLADFAFMLRDFKLAQGVYELLKTDFSNDKAWKYHAGAHEMAALSTLLIPHTANSKVPLETVDALLETAYYSYFTRCGSSYETLRCLLLAMELFKSIGRGGLEHAARWATRVLDASLTGQIGRALVMERITACFASNYLSLNGVWKYRRRKASFWSVLAAETWYDLQIQREAKKCLDLAYENLKGLPPSDTDTIFEEANEFTDNLQRTLLLSINSRQNEEGSSSTAVEQDDLIIDEEHEKLDRRPHRHSLIGINGPPSLGFQGGQLGATEELSIERDKGFE